MSSKNLDLGPLFQPFSLGRLQLKNRIVMAPMTRNLSQNGIPGDVSCQYYVKRAEGGIGLILSEGTVVDRPASRNEQNVPAFFGEQALAGWKKIIDEVHSVGGRMGPQIWHVGSAPGMSGWEPDAEVESPSGLVSAGQPRGRSMTEEDVQNTIDAFTRAAVDAKKLGFDLVEIHAAHGYLIDQFFWDQTNQRDDYWGGETLVKRSRFAAEIVKSIRVAVGPDFPILMRVSQWKQQDYEAKLAVNPKEMEAWLTCLAEAGVDVFHCSQRRFWDAEFPEIDGKEGLNFAGWAKKLTGKAAISVGSVGLSSDFLAEHHNEKPQPVGLDKLVQRMADNEFDLIAVGRALLSDAQWLTKIKQGIHGEFKGFSPLDLRRLV